MKKALLILIALFNFLICKGQSNYVVLKDQTTLNALISTYKVLPESVKTTQLSEAELNLVETIFKECIRDYNTEIAEGFRKKKENMPECIK